jgi:hypothetical protein
MLLSRPSVNDLRKALQVFMKTFCDCRLTPMGIGWGTRLSRTATGLGEAPWRRFSSIELITTPGPVSFTDVHGAIAE